MSSEKSFAQRNARVSRPERLQVDFLPRAIDEMVPRDHRCRIVWRFVESLDLEPFYETIQVTDSKAGRSSIAPEILISLWLMATLDGISSAREINRRCKTDLIYMWICGGVSVNYHTISDFRCDHVEKLNDILTSSVASLIKQGFVTLAEIGQDGMRVRAAAGSSSFRRKPTLDELHKHAKAHVEALEEERRRQDESNDDDDDPPSRTRREAAADRAAREREQRIARAIEESEKLRDKKRKDKEKVRTSTTDPDARRMKMGDGGTRPAVNVQFASDSDARVIVGVEVSGDGTDGGKLPPMLDQIEDRYGIIPERALVDSAYATQASVQQAESVGCAVVSTVPRSEQLRRHGKDPHQRQRRDNDEYEAFRKRMAEAEYQELYKKRPSVAELPNADCRNRGLTQLRIRGLTKATAVTLWHALTFNLLRMVHMGAIA
ncbi:transposase [Crateriforma spongiae]|uniref:transposase n=1 Tax=Crateriforma spongiae TaxID=2724528 RepID=UPI0039B0A696